VRGERAFTRAPSARMQALPTSRETSANGAYTRTRTCVEDANAAPVRPAVLRHQVVHVQSDCAAHRDARARRVEATTAAAADAALDAAAAAPRQAAPLLEVPCMWICAWGCVGEGRGCVCGKRARQVQQQEQREQRRIFERRRAKQNTPT